MSAALILFNSVIPIGLIFSSSGEGKKEIQCL